MDKRASADALDALHGALAKQLADAVNTPEVLLDKEGTVVGSKVNIAAMNVARQFLKDNNVTGVATKGSALDLLNTAMLPFDEKELGYPHPAFTAGTAH